MTPRFTPFLNKNTEKIHRKKNKDDASSFQGQKYENSDDEQQEYSDHEEHGEGGRSARSTRRFETEPAYQTPRKTQQYGMEEASNEELLAILKQFNNMLKKKNENPINLQQLGSLMAGYADKRRSQREQAAQRDQEISSTIEKNLKQVHGSLKNLREQSSENPSKVSLKEVRFDNEDEEDEKSYSTTGKMIRATYKTVEPVKKSPKKLKKFQTEKTEETNSEAPLNASGHSSLAKSRALLKDKDSRSSTPILKSNSNLDNTTEKSMTKKKKKGDGESPKKKKKKDSSVNKTEEIENSHCQESPEKKKKKKKARSKDRGMNTEEIVVLEKGTQTSKKSRNNGQSNSDFSSQVVGSKNAIEGWYQSNQDGKDDDIIFVSNEGHQTDEERGLVQTNQPQETSFGSQSRDYQDVNVNNFRSNHSQRVKYYDSEKSKGSSSNNVGKSQGEHYYSSKGRSQNPEAGSKQGLSDKNDQSDNNRSKSQKSRQNVEEKTRSQNHFTASEDEVAAAEQEIEAEEYEEFEQEEEKPKSSNNKKRSQTAGSKGSSQKEGSRGLSSKKEKSRESREYAEDRSLRQEHSSKNKKSRGESREFAEDRSLQQEQSQQQLGRNRAQTNEVKPQTQPSAQELSRRRGYSDPKAEKSPSNRTPSKNHQSKKPSGFRESSLDRNQNNHTHNAHNTAEKFRSISSISEDVQSDDPEKILSFNDEKGFTKSIDSSSNSHDDSETDKEDKEEASGEQIRNRVESISFSANNKAFNYRSNQSDQQQVPQSAQSKHENDSVKSKNSHSTQERLKPEERRQGRNHHRHVQYEVMSTETIQIQPSTKRSSYGYAMDRNDRTLNSASSRGLKAIAQHIVKKFKAYDEQIKKSAKEYTISVSPPRSGSRSHSYSPDGSHNQTPEMKIQEPQVAEKKYFKTAHKAQLDSVDKSSKKHRMSLQGDSGSGKKVASVKRYTVGSR